MNQIIELSDDGVVVLNLYTYYILFIILSTITFTFYLFQCFRKHDYSLVLFLVNFLSPLIVLFSSYLLLFLFVLSNLTILPSLSVNVAYSSILLKSLAGFIQPIIVFITAANLKRTKNKSFTFIKGYSKYSMLSD
ncbi:hypothetical protein K502DRAFT_324593, partial [Neoconidiobolus thromboides FSU 785]